MRPTKPSTIDEVSIVHRFEDLRKTLCSERYTHHLQKPLAYWAMPNDRRLPLALLGRRLDDLLRTPFSEISSTPGIGRKKISSLVTLLGRAAETDPAELSDDQATEAGDGQGNVAGNGGDGHTPHDAAGDGDAQIAIDTGFDPAGVSELVWSRWRHCVAEHGLEEETLGHFAPSLRDMTRVIRNTPLGDYLHCTLAEMRAMKTHGEKRVRAILEVFHCVHETIGRMGTLPHLQVRIVPRQIDRVEHWVARTRQAPGIPAERELLDGFVNPLLDQLRVDAPQQIVALAENRLGLTGPITSVRQAARRLGLTRARVYQLLNEINDIMTVRWPTGRHQIYELCEKFAAEAQQTRARPDLTRFLAAVELFYPRNRRGADGPVEPIAPKENGSHDLTGRKPR
jgi:hypothetical protein